MSIKSDPTVRIQELIEQLFREQNQLTFLEKAHRELQWEDHQKDIRIHQLEEELSKYKNP